MLEAWESRFPNCEPIAYHLREAFASRWVRFHGLPDSQRYPVDEGDCATILGRWNRILGSLVDLKGPLVLLTTQAQRLDREAASDPADSNLLALVPDARPWRTVRMDLVDPNWGLPTEWRVSACRRTWRPGSLDAILRLVIDAEACNLLIVDPECRWLAVPYDGGMDLILEDQGERDRFRSAFSGWSPDHPGGL